MAQNFYSHCINTPIDPLNVYISCTVLLLLHNRYTAGLGYEVKCWPTQWRSFQVQKYDWTARTAQFSSRLHSESCKSEITTTNYLANFEEHVQPKCKQHNNQVKMVKTMFFRSTSQKRIKCLGWIQITPFVLFKHALLCVIYYEYMCETTISYEHPLQQLTLTYQTIYNGGLCTAILSLVHSRCIKRKRTLMHCLGESSKSF